MVKAKKKIFQKEKEAEKIRVIRETPEFLGVPKTPELFDISTKNPEEWVQVETIQKDLIKIGEYLDAVSRNVQTFFENFAKQYETEISNRITDAYNSTIQKIEEEYAKKLEEEFFRMKPTLLKRIEDEYRESLDKLVNELRDNFIAKLNEAFEMVKSEFLQKLQKPSEKKEESEGTS